MNGREKGTRDWGRSCVMASSLSKRRCCIPIESSGLFDHTSYLAFANRSSHKRFMSQSSYCLLRSRLFISRSCSKGDLLSYRGKDPYLPKLRSSVGLVSPSFFGPSVATWMSKGFAVEQQGLEASLKDLGS